MTASANINETPVTGKYSRLFVSNSSGTMFPCNGSKWKAHIKTSDIDTTGFEDFGFGNGLAGIVRADFEFEMPFQVLRANGQIGNAAALLTATRFFVYECWIAHPDFAVQFPSMILDRVTGVAQVIDQPYETEVNGKVMLNVTASSRGGIYLPGSVAPSQVAMLALFTNALT